MEKNQIYKFIRSVWFFPLLLFLALTFLTVFKINGSSLGLFNTYLNGSTKDSNLLAGEPRSIRSDEWEINTPLTVSQAKNNFPRINKDIGNGQDMSVVLDVPYKEWSTVFRPQNLIFFVLPLAYAFAFKWWLIGVILILSCYILSLTLLPRRYLLASLISLSLFFSPLIQWWYQSTTILSLAYGLLLAAVGFTLLSPKISKTRSILLSVVFGYALTCMALILYVPYLIPIAIVVIAFLAGRLINLLQTKEQAKTILKRLLYIAVPTVVSMLIVVAFLETRTSAIRAISDSVYPGHRVEQSGHYSFKQLVGGYYNIQLQSDTRALHLPPSLNQSEASNFILIFPFLIPALLWVMLRKRKSKRIIDWQTILLLLVVIGFLVRLFVPFSEFLFNFIQFNRIPQDRLLMAFGVLNVILILLYIRYVETAKKTISEKISNFSGLFAFVFVLVIGITTRSAYPGYLGSILKIVLISLVIGFIVWLLLKKSYGWSLGILLIFSFLSAGHVNPLYRGLGPLVGSPLEKAMQSVDKDNKRWIVSDYANSLENLPAAYGLSSLSGVYAYPQLSLWKPIGTDAQSSNIYNRYAHVFFTVENIDAPDIPIQAYLDPPALDAFRVHVDPCSPLIKDDNVGYVLNSIPLNSSCLQQVGQVDYPALTLNLYKIKQSS
jgi:hypothetical protein